MTTGAVTALLTSDLPSTAGSEVAAVALPWFVLVTTGSATTTGAVLAAGLTGVLLGGLPGGALVQVLGARRTMLVTYAVRAVLVGAVSLLHALDALGLPTLLGLVTAVGALFTVLVQQPVVFAVCATAFGVASGLVYPRYLAVLGSRCRATLQGPAQATSTTWLSATAPVGFVVAGLMSQHVGVGAALLVGALSAATCSLLLSRSPAASLVPADDSPGPL